MRKNPDPHETGFVIAYSQRRLFFLLEKNTVGGVLHFPLQAVRVSSPIITLRLQFLAMSWLCVKGLNSAKGLGKNAQSPVSQSPKWPH